MTKYGIKDIASVLSEKKGITVTEAEEFVYNFFTLINDGLLSDKIVKIKGFGTFKLVDVQERESVDVNTGDRVTISGHSKVSFQPDAALRDMVNKPFSHFETVVLNDNVDFEKINVDDFPEEYFFDESPDVVLSNQQASELLPDNGTEGSCQGCMPIIKEGIESHNDGAPGDTAVVVRLERKACDNQEVVPSERNADDGLLSSDNSLAEIRTEEPSMSVGEDGNNSTDTVIGLGHHVSQISDGRSGTNVSNRRSLVSVIIRYTVVAVVCLIIFIGGFLIGKNSFHQVPAKTVSEKRHVANPPISEEPQGTLVNPICSAEDTVEQKVAAVRNDSSEIDAEMKSAFRVAKYGAYDIVGTDKEIEVKHGQTIKDIARIYLGEGMECYIQIHNNRTRFSAGDIVKIPKLKLKKRQGSDKVS